MPENSTPYKGFLHVLFFPFGNLSFKVFKWLSLKMKTGVQFHFFLRLLKLSQVSLLIYHYSLSPVLIPFTKLYQYLQVLSLASFSLLLSPFLYPSPSPSITFQLSVFLQHKKWYKSRILPFSKLLSSSTKQSLAYDSDPADTC